MHIRDRAEQDPQVQVMEWRPEEEFDALSAEQVMRFVKYIQREFVALLHTTPKGPEGTDEALRERLRQFGPINAFASKYKRWFQNCTTAEIVTNPRLFTALLFQIYQKELVEKGAITEEQAKANVAQSAMEAIVGEMYSKGAHRGGGDDGTIPPIRRMPSAPAS